MTAIARETERIGLVATASTTFNEPYTRARQFKALDVISHGRAGWNAVTTSDPAAAANFGRPIHRRLLPAAGAVGRSRRSAAGTARVSGCRAGRARSPGR
ncbi:LLM class flavin-dependent oxidoreductase [Streptomyces sp. DT2A-34]|uniref:LLM class flavin-dependent oxidoreductase n=1 Tax=Streptomyces sp. DT2A-34 TaxID=3051182 RepID=UPI003464897F